ncbi:uncharacterized protein Dwil_GK17344 [Drosophila willistoni]|uniref:Nuclear receptor domain-containing protein n=1 Tax=Drosophila willistoni TaxID=7260 RepID=B4MM59_DROWI|nr:protein embryonic gonad [Drosophila willistoni]EDW73068.2 uncharacterized protein Dwil_GK17344 [Drosophila willistoni]
MNQLCKVCGEPAAGFHFGAFTCEGCKSFFGRTYNNIAAIAGCKHNGDCVINKKNRTACKACRLRKCLLVGMSKSGSRYGRRSNWFKIHCLLQESTGPNAGIAGGGGGGGGGSLGGGTTGSNAISNANLEQLARLQQASNQARQTYQDKTNPCIKSATTACSLQSAPIQEARASPSASTANLPGFLQAAKYQQRQQLKVESRLSNTPSDSGASSAGDPTDDGATSVLSATTTTLRKALRQGCSSSFPNSSEPGEDLVQQQRRHQELLEIFRSHSEPLYSSFAPFTLPPVLLAAGVGVRVPPLPLFKTELSSPELDEQPIDLSLRSNRTDEASPAHLGNASNSSPTLSEPPASVSSHCLGESLNFERKPTPLDLTLVRSQTLTG